MPIYEYVCTACQHGFEELVRSDRAEDRPACPQCGNRAVARQLSTFAAHAAPERAARSSGPCGSCGSADGTCPYAS